MRERVPPLQNWKNPHAKLAAMPPTFVALFFEFWRGETHSRIVLLEVFGKMLTNYFGRQYKQITKNDFSSPTPSRHHSISFVKTSAPGGFLSSGTAVLTDFLKKQFFSDDVVINSSANKLAMRLCRRRHAATRAFFLLRGTP